VKTRKNGVYITYEQPNHTDTRRILIYMLISKLSANDCAKHVVLLLVVGHAVNLLALEFGI
jgi:hypothetical protein